MWSNRRLLMAIGDAKPPPVAAYIKFADKVVEEICVSYYSSDGKGVTFEDAEAVSVIKRYIFEGRKDVGTFDEFKYFKNVKQIESNAFGNSSFTLITLPDTLQNIGSHSFENVKGLTSLPESITNLKNGAVRGSDIKIVHLPNLTSIEGRAFSLCEKLVRVESLGQIKSLNLLYNNPSNGDFKGCKNLEFVRLPATIASIANNVFLGCISIKTVICEAVNPPTLGTSKFTSSVIESVFVPDLSVDAYKTAPNWSTFADKIKPLSTYVPQ